VVIWLSFDILYVGHVMGVELFVFVPVFDRMDRKESRIVEENVGLCFVSYVVWYIIEVG
jgi:hypothetical protein